MLGYQPREADAEELRASENFREQLHVLAEDYERRLGKLYEIIKTQQALLDAKDGELKALRKLVRELEKKN